MVFEISLGAVIFIVCVIFLLSYLLATKFPISNMPLVSSIVSGSETSKIAGIDVVPNTIKSSLKQDPPAVNFKENELRNNRQHATAMEQYESLSRQRTLPTFDENQQFHSMHNQQQYLPRSSGIISATNPHSTSVMNYVPDTVRGMNQVQGTVRGMNQVPGTVRGMNQVPGTVRGGVNRVPDTVRVMNHQREGPNNQVPDTERGMNEQLVEDGDYEDNETANEQENDDELFTPL
jgi:hypothetical protein